MEQDRGEEDLMDLDLTLDLNLHPALNPPRSSQVESIDERIRQLQQVGIRMRQRRIRRLRPLTTATIPLTTPPPPPRDPPPPPPPRDSPPTILQLGEASAGRSTPQNPQTPQTPQTCTNCRKRATDLIAKALHNTENHHESSEDAEENNPETENKTIDISNSGSGFFDCNVCLDMAADPVLTNCGHLFCWSCLYQWLHVHSQAKECPVCKGEVTDNNITPIYGRGTESKNKEKVKEEEEVVGQGGPGLKVPPRPHAKRVESLRQSVRRLDSGITFHDIIQRIGGASRVLTIGQRPVQNVVDSSQGQGGNAGSSSSSRRVLRSSDRLASLQRGGRNLETQRGAEPQVGAFPLSAAERLVQFFGNPMRRNETQGQAVEDRDSGSGIVVQSSQGAHVMDIDSIVAISSSDDSRVSDVEPVRRSRRRRRMN